MTQRRPIEIYIGTDSTGCIQPETAAWDFANCRENCKRYMREAGGVLLVPRLAKIELIIKPAKVRT